MTEILLKLPARSLHQSFKFVNKFFHDYISSNTFINLHFNQSISQPVMMVPICQKDGFKCLKVLDDVASQEISQARYLHLPLRFREPYSFRLKGGACRGLLCVTVADSFSIVLNPSNDKLIACISRYYFSRTGIGEGFGYDSLKDAYKLVQVGFDGVRVYSIKENCWKIVDDGISYYLYGTYVGNSVLLENHLPHWLFCCDLTKKRSIICFDLEMEQWVVDLELPDCEIIGNLGHWEKPNGFNLGILNGCLCLSVKTPNSDWIDLWMMEYGVCESWTKFSIKECGSHCRTILPTVKGGFDDEILLFKEKTTTTRGRRMVVEDYEWYNIRNNKASKYFTLYRPIYHDFQMKLLCFPSLVDPGVGDCTWFSQLCYHLYLDFRVFNVLDHTFLTRIRIPRNTTKKCV